MTALTAASWPDHLLTLAEWDALPEDASRRYELVEGVLLVVPRPTPLHQLVMLRLGGELDRQLPDDLTVLPVSKCWSKPGPSRQCGLPTWSSSCPPVPSRTRRSGPRQTSCSR